jgi:hypothetical protein
VEGRQHPDRDAQFRYLNEIARVFQEDGQPVISVDTKKKELVGQFANAGTQWRPAGEPAKVNVHDFPSDGLGTAVPYGIYDTTANTGWVNVGTDHDTAVFAVASIRRWWQTEGTRVYPHAGRLLISADAGGSNGYRSRAWKTELATLAAETGLTITVCHLPPGTSKWNKIEHRLFCHITMNWSGRRVPARPARRARRSPPPGWRMSGERLVPALGYALVGADQSGSSLVGVSRMASLVRTCSVPGWSSWSRMVRACCQASRAACGLPVAWWVSPRRVRTSASP